DAANGADAQRDVLGGNVGAGRREHAFEARARIGRAAHDLHRIAAAGIDHAHAQAVGIGMLLGGDHARDDEGRKLLGLVLQMFDLKPDHGELVGELFDRLVGVEMLFQPGEGEFHKNTSFRTTETIRIAETKRVSLAAKLSIKSLKTVSARTYSTSPGKSP